MNIYVFVVIITTYPIMCLPVFFRIAWGIKVFSREIVLVSSNTRPENPDLNAVEA